MIAPFTIIFVAFIVVLLGVPIGMLLAECLAALAPGRTRSFEDAQRPAADILMCAYNEESGIAETLHQLQPELGPADRVIVVADNCTDRTAEIAGQQGARVLVRTNLDQRGKDCALHFALDQLEQDHSPVVVVFDADCRFGPGSLDLIVRGAAATGRPIQSAYRMEPPGEPSAFNVVSNFAVTVKNVVRLRGLDRLGLPCLMTGSGMAFPWATLRAMPLNQGAVADDTQLSMELLLQGHGGLFCPQAQVTAGLPARNAVAKSQRKRWEHGHMTVAIRNIPRLLYSAVRNVRPSLVFMAADIAVPPLSLLVLVWMVVAVLALIWGLLGWGWPPAFAAGATGLMLVLAVLAAWRKAELKGTSARIWLMIPWYALSKLSIYVSFVFRRQRVFTRTTRDDEPSGPALASSAAARPSGTEVAGK